MTMLQGRMTFRSLATRAKNDALKDARKAKDPEGDIPPRIYHRGDHAASVLRMLGRPGEGTKDGWLIRSAGDG